LWRCTELLGSAILLTPALAFPWGVCIMAIDVVSIASLQKIRCAVR